MGEYRQRHIFDAAPAYAETNRCDALFLCSVESAVSDVVDDQNVHGKRTERQTAEHVCCDLAAQAVGQFVSHSSDEDCLHLVGQMSGADNPNVVFLRRVLADAASAKVRASSKIP